MTDTMATDSATTPYISKSKYLWGLQCHKLLWHAYNAKDLIAKPDAQTQAIFNQGHVVGELAKRLFPGGIEIGKGVDDFGEILALSKQALELRRPLYEGAFAFGGGYARADILNPVESGLWDLIEVKSTTSVKEIHLHDLAFQNYVFDGAGVKIRRCVLAHINAEFIKRGSIDPGKFFTLEDVTDRVSALRRNVRDKLNAMFTTIQLPESPEIKIGPHCSDPYDCLLHDLCWKSLPEGNVMTLYRGGAKGFKLLADGVTLLKSIPDGFKLTDNQDIQRRVAKTGVPHVDKVAIRAFLEQLRFPISYFDFETFAPAIPMFDGVHPYEQLPFQFSVHVVRSPNAEPEHHAFLAEGPDDPRPKFMHRLREVLAEDGSIVAFNAPFELARLRECSELIPEFQPWVQQVERRIVDLLLPFRNFHYHHPQQSGSASMKLVLPALTGRNYDHLAIQEGGTASLEYVRVTFTDVPEAERQSVREQLEAYCGQDTEGMIWIVRELEKVCR